MRAFLKGTSESVDFDTKTVKHFLEFEMEDGASFRIPSTAEATHRVVEILISGTQPVSMETQPAPAKQSTASNSSHCPQCNYPDTNEGQFKGVYTPGKPCPFCNYGGIKKKAAVPASDDDDEDLDIVPTDFPDGADTFGGDGGLDDPPADDPEEAAPSPFGEVHDPSTKPKVEEEVPSL
jgi:hypothetical protein